MTKKVSLKDAFVRNAGAGESATRQASVTATQSDSYTAIQDTVETVDPVPSTVPAAAMAASAPAFEPATQPAVPLYPQRASSPAAAPPKKKATFNLDASLHHRLKIAAAIHGREMVDIVEDALETYLPRLDQKAG